jgi:hypothetical protein
VEVDVLFLGASVAGLCWAVYLALGAFRRQHGGWVPAVLWGTFASGLLAQGLAPHLSIEGNAFVMPPLVPGSEAIQPDEIVSHARRMQALSGTLTVGGALGLAVYYWRALLGPRGPPKGA